MCWSNLSVRSHFILWRLKKQLFRSFNIWGYIYFALGFQWHLYIARLVRPAITLFLCNPINSHKICVMCPARSAQLNHLRLHCFLKQTIITSLFWIANINRYLYKFQSFMPMNWCNEILYIKTEMSVYNYISNTYYCS